MITAKTVRIDMMKRYLEPINTVQYEVDSRILDIYLTAANVPVNVEAASVVFYAVKPDGTILFNACDIIDAAAGHVQYTVTQQTCAAAGELRCWLLIVKDGSELRSMEFAVTVHPSDDDSEAIESTSEFSALQAALSIVSGYDARITAVEEAVEEFEGGGIDVTGWVAASGWSYLSVDDPIGVISATGHGLSVGWRIKLVNGGNAINGIVVAKTTDTFTFLHEIDPTDSQAKYLMADSAISDAYYSPVKAPQGFPLEPVKWTVKAVDYNSNIVTSPVSGDWYHLGSFSLAIPIGSWIIEYRNHASAYNFASPTTYLYMYSVLETSTGAITAESELYTVDFGVGAQTRSGAAMRCSAPLTLTAKTTYNLYSRYLSNLTAGSIRLNNGTYCFIKATCAYL